MSGERADRREALLHELRRSHRAEPAPAGLRQRLLEQAEGGPEAFVPRRRLRAAELASAWSERLGKALPGAALAGLAALVLALGLRAPWPASSGLDTEGGLVEGAPVALGPEPSTSGKSRPPALTAPGAPAPGEREPRRGWDVWASSSASMGGPRQSCPLDSLPRGAVIMPQKSGAPGLAAHTFEQQTFSCGPLTRRYLEQLPPGLTPRSSAPVLILLHDAGESAETMHARKEGLAFEQIARKNGAILVYANAAPGRRTSAGLADSGAWETELRGVTQVDDDDYLSGIIADLTLRHVIEGSNDVFLVGYRQGAVMALDAAVRRPSQFAGVAAFSAPDLASASPALPRAQSRLSRVFIVVEAAVRGSADAWRSTLPAFARGWAQALGIDQKVSASRWSFGDPGRSAGSLERFDVALPATGSSALRLFVIEGDVERPPGAPHAWDFLTGVDGADPRSLQDRPVLPVDPLFVNGESMSLEDADGHEPPMLLEEEVLHALPSGRSEPR